MLKIDRQKQVFLRLETPSLADVSISERYHLQEYICNSPEAFFTEIGQDLFLIDKEVHPSNDVEDRIDILALDKEGQAVVIELKRGSNKLQMFQAISYAAMVANWQPDDFLTALMRRSKNNLETFLARGKKSIGISASFLSQRRLIIVSS
jgi:RecB family endonuclease NucS